MTRSERLENILLHLKNGDINIPESQDLILELFDDSNSSNLLKDFINWLKDNNWPKLDPDDLLDYYLSCKSKQLNIFQLIYEVEASNKKA